VADPSAYPPGTFGWVDLMTTDPAAATAFYGAVFGWEVGNEPFAGGAQTPIRADGALAGGLTEIPAENRAAGSRPQWFNNVVVEDVDEAVRRAGEHGGTVHGALLDLPGFGRVAIVEDPTGASFAAWQPDAAMPTPRFNDPGFLVWNELNTHDPAAATAFYGGLLGWAPRTGAEGGSLPTTTFVLGDRMVGGLIEIQPEWGEVPPHWLPYFAVAAIDDAVATIRERGGTVHAGPQPSPYGRIAICEDPQGAAFGVFEATAAA